MKRATEGSVAAIAFAALALLGCQATPVAPAKPAEKGAPSPAAKTAASPAASPVAKAGWEAEWERTLAAAKQEGKVVLAAGPYQEVREQLPAAFQARFGIPLEYLGASGSETFQRLRAERLAGQYSTDVVLTGTPTLANSFYPERMLKPFKDQLIVPEVVDPSKWKQGKLWFVDPEERYILRLTSTVDGLFSINTDVLRPETLRSIRDLLDPRWKGKMTTSDPTVPGAGAGAAAFLYKQFGEEFVRQLYLDQDMIVTRDERQITDWLARGTYPITLFTGPQVAAAQAQGFPVLEIFRLPDALPPVDAATGMAVLIDKAPHPNAAKVFLNWLASKEGLEVYARGIAAAPTRTDISATWLAPEEIPQPGQEYFDNGEWNWVVGAKEDARKRMGELLSK